MIYLDLVAEEMHKLFNIVPMYLADNGVSSTYVFGIDKFCVPCFSKRLAGRHPSPGALVATGFSAAHLNCVCQ